MSKTDYQTEIRRLKEEQQRFMELRRPTFDDRVSEFGEERQQQGPPWHYIAATLAAAIVRNNPDASVALAVETYQQVLVELISRCETECT